MKVPEPNDTSTVTHRQTVWQGNFLKAMLLTYRDHRGLERSWEAVERVNCAGIVAVIPVTTEGDVLFIRQFRPVLNRFVIEFPAGLNDRGELLCEAARRELVEETGYAAASLEFLAEGPISSGMSSEILTVFLGRDAGPAPPELLQRYPAEETESIQVIKAPLMSAYEVLDERRRHGDIADLKLYGFIELARRKLNEQG